MLAGCGGLQPPIGAPGAAPQGRELTDVPNVISATDALRKPGWLSPEARGGRDLLYISDGNNNIVYVYQKDALSHGPIGEITYGVDGPCGLAVDLRNDLYVANGNAPNIMVFKPGQTQPFRTYTNGLKAPCGIAVSPHTGRLYVANGAYTVVEYPKGSLNPDRTISFQGLEGHTPIGLALDQHDNVFVTALGYPTARAYEIPAGSATPEDLGISGMYVMVGIAVDDKDDVSIVDQGPEDIRIFPPGSDTPKKIITQGLIQPEFIAFGRSERRLYVPDAGVYHYNGGLWVYSYPHGKLLAQIHLPGYPTPLAVVVTPP
jgi:DNA-binding beta-propeller fold protein YncE